MEPYPQYDLLLSFLSPLGNFQNDLLDLEGVGKEQEPSGFQ